MFVLVRSERIIPNESGPNRSILSGSGRENLENKGILREFIGFSPDFGQRKNPETL